MARLIITSGSQPEQSVDLGTGTITVGREAGNDVVLSGESKASRRHCQVAPVAGGWEVIDLQSMNGTRVNGQPVKKQRLVPGDTIEVGLSKLRFDDPQAQAARDSTPSVCYLEFTAGDRRGERILLSGPRTTFGRRPTNTVVLEDRMASGHHAEIVRDLNGYTIRDLGSMNGTLVNGEPTTETLLAHGSRVRIGGARMVFKDPAMKDVEVALAGIDEDDGGWGMMADVDLAKAGRGGAGGLIAALLFLAVAGGGAWWVNQQKSEVAREDPDIGNMIVDGRFESSEALWWVVDEGSPATLERTAKGGVKGSAALLVRHDPSHGPGLGLARYSDDLEMVASSAYRVSATLKHEGSGRADLAMQWVRRANPQKGATAASQTVRIASASSAWTPITSLVRRPPWAEVGRLVLLVGPGSGLRLDDVRCVPVEGTPEGGGRIEAGADTDAFLSTTGVLDLARTATVVALGAAPWARLADGRLVGGPAGFVPDGVPALAADGGAEVAGKLVDEKGDGVPGRIRWSKETGGLSAKVTVDGATAVGLSADLPIVHLEDGIGVLGSFGNAKLPAEPGQSRDGLRKALLGDPAPRAEWKRPPTLIAVESVGGADALRFETLAADDAGLLRVRAWAAGASGDVRLVTAFEGERVAAREQLSASQRLQETSVGEAIAALRRVAQEFPFQAEVHKTALETAETLEKKAREDQVGLQQALDRFTVLGSEETLADAERRAAALTKQFPKPTAASETLEQGIAQVVAAVVAARTRFDSERAVPEVRRLAKLAALLEQQQGYELEAAMYYGEIVSRYEALAAAGSGTELAQQVDEARKHWEALKQRPEIAAALPEVPHK